MNNLEEFKFSVGYKYFIINTYIITYNNKNDKIKQLIL